MFELTRAAPRACVPNLSGLPKNMCSAVSPTDQRSCPRLPVPLRFAHVLHIGEILFLRILQQFDKMRSLFSGPLNGFSENRNGSVLHSISLFQLFLWPDKSVSAKSFPHQRRLSAALMKDRQRFADKLSHYQLPKGPSLSKLAGFRDALIQQFRTARLGIPEHPRSGHWLSVPYG